MVTCFITFDDLKIKQFYPFTFLMFLNFLWVQPTYMNAKHTLTSVANLV